MLSFRASEDGTALVLVKMKENHNHEISEVSVMLFCTKGALFTFVGTKMPCMYLYLCCMLILLSEPARVLDV